MSVIVVNNLAKHFDPPKRGNHGKMGPNSPQGRMGIIRAVDNISFEVKKGEVFGFLGPNGAGKTTTIRMMTGVLRPTKGNVSIFGHDVWKNQILVKQITGNVPEEANVYFDLTGLQNLMFIGEIYGVPKKIRLKRAEALLKKFELYEKRNLKSMKYSKGMKQRLLLCMGLMSNPEILFLDEPTSGLDVQSARIIKQLIREYNEKGVTIFLTTHDMEVANELCHRIAIINYGKIISLDTPKNLKMLTQEYKAIDFFFANGVSKTKIEELNTVIEAQEVREGFHVIVEDIHEGICEIVDFIKENHLIIKQLNTHQPKLEDAFLKIIERGGRN
ncbi:MAG: ATP-binding cassette domain-containing protein [Candidatus Lokiarchaeota archaeon]|nr:ATP-binding cassette domain-containing protein [Candidatus Lokiarchaeota archaeon]